LTLALDFAHALVTQHSRAPRGTRLVGGRVRFRTGVDKWWRLKPIGQVPSPAASDRLGSMTPALGQGGRPERGEKKLYAGHAHRYLPPRPHSAGIDNFLITLTTLTTLTRGGPPPLDFLRTAGCWDRVPVLSSTAANSDHHHHRPTESDRSPSWWRTTPESARGVRPGTRMDALA
jgi:hypothetical protein